jgi:hypothetical protein
VRARAFQVEGAVRPGEEWKSPWPFAASKNPQKPGIEKSDYPWGILQNVSPKTLSSKKLLNKGVIRISICFNSFYINSKMQFYILKLPFL